MDWALLGVTITKSLLPLAIPFFAYLGHAAGTWLHAHAKSTAATTALDVLDNIVATVVAQAEQTLVPNIKAKLATGSLTAADGLEIRDQVVDLVMSLIQSQGAKAITNALNMSQASLQQFVTSKVEAEVYHLKNPGQDGLPQFTKGVATAPIAGSPEAMTDCLKK